MYTTRGFSQECNSGLLCLTRCQLRSCYPTDSEAVDLVSCGQTGSAMPLWSGLFADTTAVTQSVSESSQSIHLGLAFRSKFEICFPSVQRCLGLVFWKQCQYFTFTNGSSSVSTIISSIIRISIVRTHFSLYVLVSLSLHSNVYMNFEETGSAKLNRRLIY